MSGLNDACCQLPRVPSCDGQPNFGWHGTRTKYAYDANGNVTSRQGSSITWSSYNYPTTINDSATGESVSFVYGPDRRAWFESTQSSSGTETVDHVGGLFDIVTSGGVTEYRHYIYAGGEPVAIDARGTGTNSFYYLLSDHQGSISAITNSAGAVVVGESFTAYGNRRNPTTWSGAPDSSDLSTIAGITRNGYTFQDTLGTMGLNDMVGRVQDAITGRFLSADPTIPDKTNPQDYNHYGYTINNPLTYTDPSGFGETSCAPGAICPTGNDAGPSEWTNFSFTLTWSDGSSDTISDQDDAGPSEWTNFSLAFNFSDGSSDTISGQDDDPRLAQPQSDQACSSVVCPVVQAPRPLPDSGQVNECTGCWVALAVGGLEITASDALAAATGRLIAGARGIGQILKNPFSPKPNSAGGTVWTSEGTIYQSDFSGIVNDSLYGDQDVSILSGVHGFPDGTMLPDSGLYQEDLETFGNVPGVNVYNVPEMSPEEVNSVLSGPGTIIGGFCNSGVCLLGRF